MVHLPRGLKFSCVGKPHLFGLEPHRTRKVLAHLHHGGVAKLRACSNKNFRRRTLLEKALLIRTCNSTGQWSGLTVVCHLLPSVALALHFCFCGNSCAPRCSQSCAKLLQMDSTMCALQDESCSPKKAHGHCKS